LQFLSAQGATLSVVLFLIRIYRESRAGRRPGAPCEGEKVPIFQYAGGSKVEQYYTVQVATGETALPDFNYLIQYQNNYHAAVMLGIGIIIGCLIAIAFLRR
jgi:hypothetical protein